MIVVGVPFLVPELTQSGSPYGPSRIVGPMSNKEITEADTKVARALGKRVSELAQKLTQKNSCFVKIIQLIRPI